MRLLIVTQTVDTNDPVLGFFHHWLEVFAPQFEAIHVICLKEGMHTLPKNVVVHSLGKEKGGNRFLYAFRFLKLAYGLHKEYDAVFVHMNPEYVVLAGDFWRLTGKKIGLWYNHSVGSVWLRLAVPLVHIVFHTSPYAYPARYTKARLMSAGVDTVVFAPHSGVREPNSIYFQGRVAPAKRVHILLEALRKLRATVPATVTIVGPEDSLYGATLRSDFKDLMEVGAVHFMGPRRNEETPAFYGTHSVAVNLTADGNFDKTVLEAMACETPVVISSQAFADLMPSEWIVPAHDATALADALQRMLALSPTARQELGKGERTAVIQRHSLHALADTLAQNLSASAH